MKFIYKKRKSKTVKDQALKEFRKTRAKIQKDHPELLEKMRLELKAAEEAKKSQAKPKPSKTASKRKAKAQNKTKKQKMPDFEERLVQIDRTKNIETVLKFLAMNPENAALKNELKDFLQ